jgi:exopolyphosphatase/guanosine-5'-triphosphate,3'-diphosphate pyrophosphatase
MPTFAAIDIGSNSCRLKIACIEEHGLKTMYEDREVNRLGESVFQTGVLSPEAMERTIKALRRFHKGVQTHAVDRVRVVATSAMRDARNALAFVEWVKSETGWDVEVISGLEEGRLIHLGVVQQEPGARGKCLLIDLGGGSCEVTVSDKGRVQAMVSLPLGAVRLQGFLESDPPAKEDVARLKQFIDRELALGEKKLGRPRVTTVIATSGTAAALAEASAAVAAGELPMRKSMKAGSRGKVAGKGSAGKTFVRLKPDEASTEGVRRLADTLVMMSNAEREAVPGIGPKRSEIIVGGALVYASLLERLGLGGFHYSPLGLRDGMLAQMLAETDQRAPAHKALESERWAGVLEVCRRYAVDLKKAEPVRAHAKQLFRAMATVHGLPPEYELWLETAAMLQEVGKFMNHQGHYRHAQYIIANSEIFGFSPEQRAVVSAIARYGGKSRPDAVDRVMRAVPMTDQPHIPKAVVLLRLAAALNRDRATATLRLGVAVYPKRVVLELGPSRAGAELEAWALKREAPYFREVFRRELFTEVL